MQDDADHTFFQSDPIFSLAKALRATRCRWVRRGSLAARWEDNPALRSCLRTEALDALVGILTWDPVGGR